jgi:hypothetical protein
MHTYAPPQSDEFTRRVHEPYGFRLGAIFIATVSAAPSWAAFTLSARAASSTDPRAAQESVLETIQKAILGMNLVELPLVLFLPPSFADLASQIPDAIANESV